MKLGSLFDGSGGFPLAAAGNRAVVCKGWEQAAQTITDYLQGGKT